MSYQDFLINKHVRVSTRGFDVDASQITHKAFPFQREVIGWGCRMGASALFEDCGLGKSLQELEWGRLVHEHTGRDVIIHTPLAVAQQFKREGDKFGIPVTVCKTQDDVRPGINVANYERLHHFDSGGMRESFEKLIVKKCE